MRAERRKHMLFAGGKKWRKKSHSTPQRHHLFIFLLLLWVFFTMPSEKRLSLNNKGAIVALRGEGHSLRVIGRKLEIAHSTEKNRAKGLGQHHSGVPPVSLRIDATAHAGGGRCPRRSHKILDAF